MTNGASGSYSNIERLQCPCLARLMIARVASGGVALCILQVRSVTIFETIPSQSAFLAQLLQFDGSSVRSAAENLKPSGGEPRCGAELQRVIENLPRQALHRLGLGVVPYVGQLSRHASSRRGVFGVPQPRRPDGSPPYRCQSVAPNTDGGSYCLDILIIFFAGEIGIGRFCRSDMQPEVNQLN